MRMHDERSEKPQRVLPDLPQEQQSKGDNARIPSPVIVIAAAMGVS